jgi:hypothetical protein
LLVRNDVPLIFMETSQQRRLRLTGVHLLSFDEKGQFGLPVFLGYPSFDPDAARVFARLWHVEIPWRIFGRPFYG